MFVWSYGSGAYSGVVDSFFVFVVVGVGPVSFVFSVGVFCTCCAAVFLSVVFFLVGFSTIGTTNFRIFNLHFHNSLLFSYKSPLLVFH